MKKIYCLIITILILITSIGCNNSTQKENEEVLTASGYILDVWENKDLYNNAIFYNSETEEYSKIIIDNIDKYYNDEYIIGGRSDYIKIYYTKNNKDIIISNINPLKEDKNPKNFWIHNSPDKTLSYVESFCGFEYSDKEPVDFFNAACFFIFFNYANNFNSLTPKAFIGEDGVTHHYYNKEEFLSKVKEFFPTFDKSQVYKLSSLGEYSKDQPNYLQYDKENDLIYAFDGYSLSGAGTSFVKNYEKLDNDIFKATIVEIDYRIKTIEEVLYEYRLNNDGSVYLINVKRRPATISNVKNIEDLSSYAKYIYSINDSPLISKSWDKPENIPTDTFVQFLSCEFSYEDYWDINNQVHKIPFDIIYDNILEYEHLDLSERYLKSLNIYDKENNCFIANFEMPYFYDSVHSIQIENVIENENNIIIHFYSYILQSEFSKLNLPKNKTKTV